ncbi:hypothetical protein K2X33_00570 [bacterium]|nr:hypothetical protein [bacterium]
MWLWIFYITFASAEGMHGNGMPYVARVRTQAERQFELSYYPRKEDWVGKFGIHKFVVPLNGTTGEQETGARINALMAEGNEKVTKLLENIRAWQILEANSPQRPYASMFQSVDEWQKRTAEERNATDEFLDRQDWIAANSGKLREEMRKQMDEIAGIEREIGLLKRNSPGIARLNARLERERAAMPIAYDTRQFSSPASGGTEIVTRPGKKVRNP